MKKVFAVFVLLAALVAISYFSAKRTETQRLEKYQEGYAQGTKEADKPKQKADSLTGLLDLEKKRFQDSIREIDSNHAIVVDSLNQEIATRDTRIAALKTKKPVQKNKDLAITHSQILEYYKKRLNTIPKDLSGSERQIVLNEIRDETARKYSISLSDFEKIRKSNNLVD
jgi:septal ring factor EnvC (AmiA/AmiB activator)